MVTRRDRVRNDAAVLGFLTERAVCGVITVPVRDVAEACALSVGGAHTSLRRLVAAGRVAVVHVARGRHGSHGSTYALIGAVSTQEMTA